ncbi:MAG: 50S ribosomal protein L25 [Patescibacteria group bacterium]
MQTINLEVQSRDTETKAKNLRKTGLLPAEYYGKGVKNKSLQMDYQVFRKLFRTAGKNTILELDVDGKEKINVLVHDVQFNPVTDLMNHVEFINVRMDEVIYTKIPVKFIGQSKAVKDLGGILSYNLKELEISCLPKDLIPFIEVSVAPVTDFHTNVKVKDLEAPANITIETPGHEVVVSAVAPREEEAATTTAATPVEGAAPAAGAAATPAAAAAPAGKK